MRFEAAVPAMAATAVAKAPSFTKPRRLMFV